MSAGRYVAGDALRGYVVGFSVYDGARGVAFEARARLRADCLATRRWFALEALRGTEWERLPSGTENWAAAADHLEAVLEWAAELVAQGNALPEALGWSAARSDSHASGRELADWSEFRAAEREVAP